MTMHAPQASVSTIETPVLFGWLRYLPATILLVVSLALVAWRGDVYALPRLEDDAYYYLVIARHLVEQGASSYTPGILTNGYHPLWLLVVTAAGALFGFSLVTLKVTELVAMFAGFVLFIRLFRITRFVDAVLATFGLWYVLRSFALNGMETSLLFPGMVLLIGSLVSTAATVAQHRTWLILIGSLWVIGTRLDSAVFVLPMLAVAPIATRAKAMILGVLAVAGLGYMGVNKALFDSAMPISGGVKSLGGLQFNDLYLASLLTVQPKTLVALTEPVVPYLAMIGALALAIWFSRSQRVAHSVLLVYAAAAGMALYGAKLAFGSSWVTWPWYNYPTLIFALLAVHLIQQRERRPGFIGPVIAAAGVLFVAAFLHLETRARPDGFPGLNKEFIARHGDLFNGRVVAMGDRAGSFGYFYRPGVYQLEGLVNSKSFVDVLKAGGDLRPHLCSRGIDVFVSYVSPDRSYRQQDLAILRPSLTRFPGPTLRVDRSEEIASLQDLAIYDDPNDDGNTRIAAWRLKCGG